MCTHNGILLNYLKKMKFYPLQQMDPTGGHYVEWNSLIQKVYDLLYLSAKILKSYKYKKGKKEMFFFTHCKTDAKNRKFLF